MFSIYDGRESFYQWDLDRKIIVNDASIKEVHFCNCASKDALVCNVYEYEGKRVSDVPNILLQDAWAINVYAYDKNYTKYSCNFKVTARQKPNDYVYTETEVFNYKKIENKIEELEKNVVTDEQISEAVESYLEKNPIEHLVTSVNNKTGQVVLTAEDVGAISNDNKTKYDDTANKSHVHSNKFTLDNITDSKITNWDKVSEKANSADLATVAMSGNYNDLKNKPSIVTVDNTLSVSDVAADAKVTGDKISELKGDLSRLSEEKVENPLTGVVGQILEIETVDESGKPKTYKAVNKPSGVGEVTDEQISNAVDNYMKEHPFTETDPTVPDWAKQSQKPTYTASEVGALPVGTKIPSKTSDLQNDSGFLTEHQDLSDYALKSEVPKSASDVGADASGTAESKVSEHNISDTAHNDIRLLIQGLIERLNALANSDDETLDQMNEVVAYIKSNKSLIDAITTSKVSVSDIIDNLTTNVSNKPLSAAQGVALKALIDAIAVPTKLSELENDSGFLTEHQDLSGYATKDEIPKTASDVGADASGTAESKVSAHNVSDTAHNDIRLLVQGLTARLNVLADSDDTTLDQMSEVVAYIKNNKNLIDDITTSKVNVSDIINNLTTNLSNKVLSASMGVELKKLIDAIKVPVNLSELAGDTTHRTVTDAEKTAWNNKSTFSGNYNDLTNKPSLFSGNYNDLSGKPTLITEERVNELINAKLPKSAEEVQY